jgi:fructose-1,6-bisphosphatase
MVCPLRRGMEVKPRALNQRAPIIPGSREEVERVISCHVA